MTGPEQIGQTFQLLPDNYQKCLGISFSSGSDPLLLSVAKKQSPLLAAGLNPFYQENLNQSMLKTRRLFLSGKSIEEIMALRQIKRGTVNDHLIEWAIIDDQFPYHYFATKQQFPPLSWKLPYHILQKKCRWIFKYPNQSNCTKARDPMLEQALKHYFGHSHFRTGQKK